MDVNGTRFHLIKGEADWLKQCHEEGQPAGRFAHLDFDTKSGAMMLKPQFVLFVSARGGAALDPEDRRGAAADSFNNWYWISNDRQKIFWRPEGSKKTLVFWEQKKEQPAPAPSDQFAPVTAEPLTSVMLSGLAVTTHHYLVVGNLSARGLFIFDLHAGGPPMLLLFPPGVPFEPCDMSPAPWGGVWILDRRNRAYWGLDRQFRVLSEADLLHEIEPGEQEIFHVVGGKVAIRPARRFPNGFALPPEVEYPVSIEGLPDGSVLLLDSPAYLPHAVGPTPASRIHHYRMSERLDEPLTLGGDVSVVEELTHTSGGQLSVVGYDFAFIAEDHSSKGQDTLYVVEREGNQSVVFLLDFKASPRVLKIKTEFLPMYFFGSRALVASGQKLYYDVLSGDGGSGEAARWVQLHSIEEHRYESEATLMMPVFDGKERDCVWHRLFLDACIPEETALEVWTRAHNDRLLLANVEWQSEPTLYLRGAGTELPFYDAFPQFAQEEMPENTGTWELLFQQARGRYLEIKLRLRGNGRTTPHLHALRAYYPRFSYPRNYLPDVYLEDAELASFLERFLANEEGFYAELEGKISNVSVLFDARSAPAEALDWLAGWVGIVLDPLWANIQQQRQKTELTEHLPIEIKRSSHFDRRRSFIRFARKLFERRGTPSGILFALQLLLDPCLEVTLYKLKRAAVRPKEFAGFITELAGYGLRQPSAVMREEEFEDLLYDYMLAPARPTKVRIVERYRTRGGRRFQAGDASVQSGDERSAPEAPDAFAHQFSVLIPETLTPEEEAMVRRIAEMEKPAHTQFDVRRYWDFFRVGETRLGIDTVLGEESRFIEMVIGRSYLAEGYLHSAHPMDVAVRVVSDRDRLGDMPSL
ncbi:MAG TPA: hypothetical protein VM911_14480 [Pyrinomonadaceae bacterium]|nr:hypothetical protein [Pyrinomonadaceae bacterium]